MSLTLPRAVLYMLIVASTSEILSLVSFFFCLSFHLFFSVVFLLFIIYLLILIPILLCVCVADCTRESTRDSDAIARRESSMNEKIYTI